MRAPAMRPLIIEPMTMPGSSGIVSGADSGAVRPSKTPRTPPSTRPRSHLFIVVARLEYRSPLLLPAPRDSFREFPGKKASRSGEQQEQDAHHEIGADQGADGPVLVRPATCG